MFKYIQDILNIKLHLSLAKLVIEYLNLKTERIKTAQNIIYETISNEDKYKLGDIYAEIPHCPINIKYAKNYMDNIECVYYIKKELNSWSDRIIIIGKLKNNKYFKFYFDSYNSYSDKNIFISLLLAPTLYYLLEYGCEESVRDDFLNYHNIHIDILYTEILSRQSKYNSVYEEIKHYNQSKYKNIFHEIKYDGNK
jgi:hypothetical protein